MTAGMYEEKTLLYKPHNVIILYSGWVSFGQSGSALCHNCFFLPDWICVSPSGVNKRNSYFPLKSNDRRSADNSEQQHVLVSDSG